MFGLSKRELESRFLRSEIVLLAWRSQEMSAKLEADTQRAGMGTHNFRGDVPQGLPAHFYNADGEIDLRQVSGMEAFNFFSSQGVHLPIMYGRRREK